jgi:ribosomal protein L9
MAANPAIIPDFEELAEASQTMTNNFRLLSNIPAVDNGAAILGAIQELRQQMQQQTQQMQQQMLQQMQQQMMDMEQRLAARISAKYAPFYSYSADDVCKSN